MPYFCDNLIRKNKQDYTDALYCALGRAGPRLEQKICHSSKDAVLSQLYVAIFFQTVTESQKCPDKNWTFLNTDQLSNEEIGRENSSFNQGCSYFNLDILRVTWIFIDLMLIGGTSILRNQMLIKI